MKCQCGRTAICVNGDVIYPHRPDLRHKWFWRCEPCGAYVGCHGLSQNPLGTLADAETRKARNQAHAAFDPLWRSGRMKRTAAYQWLAEQLGIEFADCHIARFDATTCAAVIEAVRGLQHETVGS